MVFPCLQPQVQPYPSLFIYCSLFAQLCAVRKSQNGRFALLHHPKDVAFLLYRSRRHVVLANWGQRMVRELDRGIRMRKMLNSTSRTKPWKKKTGNGWPSRRRWVVSSHGFLHFQKSFGKVDAYLMIDVHRAAMGAWQV